MKSLRTLIRLQKQRVDTLRRRIGELENQKQVHIKQSERLAKELEDELALAKSQPEMGGFFGDFADRIKNRRAAIAQDVRQLDVQIGQLTDSVRLLFSEQKRYEILLEKKIAEQKAKEAKRENEQLDEVALMGYTRKKPEDSL